jgi:gluconokinase
VSVVFLTGVSGSGKSTIGSALAARLRWAFLDADDLHPQENIRKMAEGIPLTDDDRWPWLEAVGQAALAASAGGVVVACSALRRVYRDVLRSERPQACVVQLVGREEIIEHRTATRNHAFMPTSLLC